jgi:BMFP domain-containing protein YqiC
MQTDKRILDDLARLASGTLGAFSGLKTETEAFIRDQLERILSRMDLVRRDEFEAVKAMASKAREENDSLSRRLAALEASPGKPAKSADNKKSSKPAP